MQLVKLNKFTHWHFPSNLAHLSGVGISSQLPQNEANLPKEMWKIPSREYPSPFHGIPLPFPHFSIVFLFRWPNWPNVWGNGKMQNALLPIKGQGPDPLASYISVKVECKIGTNLQNKFSILPFLPILKFDLFLWVKSFYNVATFDETLPSYKPWDAYT